MGKALDLTGQTFNRWTVIAKTTERTSSGSIKYEAVCLCGTHRVVSGKLLVDGASMSCGCYNRERTIEANTTHGMSRTPLRDAWAAMMQRCYNPKNPRYERYGGRGIAVCERWHSADKFIADNRGEWRPGLTIDRKDNDGPYAPENVRWVGYAVQSRNTSTTHLLTHRGQTMCVSDWAAHVGLPTGALFGRLGAGWSVEAALDTPLDAKRAAKTRIDLNGSVNTLAGWARATGFPPTAIQARLKRGWSVERALTTPLNRQFHQLSTAGKM